MRLGLDTNYHRVRIRVRTRVRLRLRVRMRVRVVRVRVRVSVRVRGLTNGFVRPIGCVRWGAPLYTADARPKEGRKKGR